MSMRSILEIKGLFQAHPILTSVLITAIESIILYRQFEKRFRDLSQETERKIKEAHGDILNRLKQVSELEQRLKTEEDINYTHNQKLLHEIPQQLNSIADELHKRLELNESTARKMDEKLKQLEGNVQDVARSQTSMEPDIRKKIDALQQYVDDENAATSSAFDNEIQTINRKINKLSHSVKDCIEITQKMLRTESRKLRKQQIKDKEQQKQLQSFGIQPMQNAQDYDRRVRSESNLTDIHDDHSFRTKSNELKGILHNARSGATRALSEYEASPRSDPS